MTYKTQIADIKILQAMYIFVLLRQFVWPIDVYTNILYVTLSGTDVYCQEKNYLFQHFAETLLYKPEYVKTKIYTTKNYKNNNF